MDYKPFNTEALRFFERHIRILARDIERRAAAHGLPSCGWFVLEELERSEAISLRDLALASAKSIPAASKAVKRLAATGMVDVQQVPGDKRLNAISITDAGVQFLRKERARRDLSSRYHEIVTADDLYAVAKSLSALVDNMRLSRPVRTGLPAASLRSFGIGKI